MGHLHDVYGRHHQQQSIDRNQENHKHQNKQNHPNKRFQPRNYLAKKFAKQLKNVSKYSTINRIFPASASF